MPICTGPTNSVHQEQEGEQLAERQLAGDAELTPTTTTAALASAGGHLAGGERQGDQALGPRRGRPVPLDRVVDALPGALLDRVGPHGGGADDGLGDGAEQVADPLADQRRTPRETRRWKVRSSRNSGRKQTQTSSVSCHE